MEQLKIALFTDSFLPGKGGTENAIKNLVLELQNQNHLVRIYCPDYHKNEQNFEDFSIFRVKSLKLTDNEMMVLPSLCKKAIEKDLKNFNPNLIYFCSASGMAKWAVKFGKKLKLPIVATIHTKFHMAFYNSSKSKLLTAILIKSLANKLNHADAVTTVSNDMVQVLKNYGCKKEIKVIRNGLNNLPPCNKTEKDLNKISFLYCGHVIKVKNIQFTLKCLSDLKKRYKFDNFVFNIAGSGNYQKTLQKLAKKLNIENNVNFLGYISDKTKLNELYANSYLSLFPSLFDNDSLVIIESAQNNTPTLALFGYGCGERIIDGETGFLANYNEEDFTNKIWEVVNDKKLYQHVLNNLKNFKGENWEQITKQYVSFFEEQIQKHKNKIEQ